jgi:predicted nucleotidyltransferase
MTTVDLPIAIDRDLITRFCRERSIRSLSLFGSVLRDEFASGALRGVGLRYFSFGEELETILGHRVDFCSQLHPAFHEGVARKAVKVYERS